MSVAVDISDLDLGDKVVRGKMIAYGGRSDVYRGTLQKDGTDVALKVFRVRSIDPEPPDLLKPFYREVLLWRKIKHANIVPLLGYVLPREDPPILVLPWYTNGSLDLYLRSNPNVDRHTLVLDVLNGLVYLHSISVIHGDLKPRKLLVDARGRASLCSSWLSQTVEEASENNDESMGGTPRYMAPEILYGHPKTLASDMWAAGCLIAQVFTGDLPYQNHSQMKIFPAIIQGESPYESYSDVIDVTLWDCISRCWSPEPGKRLKASELIKYFTPPDDPSDGKSTQLDIPLQTSQDEEGSGVGIRITSLDDFETSASDGEGDGEPSRKRRNADSIQSVSMEYSPSIGHSDSQSIELDVLPQASQDEEASDESLQTPADAVENIKGLSNSVQVFRQSAFDIAEIAETRQLSFVAWSTIAETRFSLHTTGIYPTVEDKLDAHHNLATFRRLRRAAHDRLSEDLTLVNNFLASLNDVDVQDDVQPPQLAMAFILAWIVVSDAEEFNIATTPAQRTALNSAFLKAIKYDAKKLFDAKHTPSKIGGVATVRTPTSFNKAYRRIWMSSVERLHKSTEMIFLGEADWDPSQPAGISLKMLAEVFRHLPWIEKTANSIFRLTSGSNAPASYTTPQPHDVLTSYQIPQAVLERFYIPPDELNMAVEPRGENSTKLTISEDYESLKDEEQEEHTTENGPSPLEKTAPQLGKAPSFDTLAHSPTGKAKNTDLRVNNRSFPATKFHMHLFNFLAMRRLPEPKPVQVRDGPDNDVTWTASITVEGYFAPYFKAMERRTFKQTGRTKYAAKEAAARDALVSLGVNINALQD